MLDKSKLVRVLSGALVTVQAQRQALLVGGALQEAEAGEVANGRQGSGWSLDDILLAIVGLGLDWLDLKVALVNARHVWRHHSKQSISEAFDWWLATKL